MDNTINHIYRPKANKREKLFETLDDSVNNKLTIISAPAGFGKTTLLSAWITMRKKRSICAAWLNLDEEDNDQIRFWIYFVSAIKAAIPNVGDRALKLLKTAGTSSMETIITVFINEIQEAKKKTLFILEDFHRIKNKEIVKELNFFIKHMPNTIRLIITSRSEMTELISGVKISERAVEIGQEDLRFSNEETAYFINEIMELKASEEELKKFYEITEGWPSGLHMAALACRRKGIEAIKGKTSSILEGQFDSYFIEDILNSQPPDIYEFLIKTALLDTFSYELCADAIGIPNCKIILSQVLEMNLFISCLEEKESWYRYHSLFTGFLKRKIEKEQPDLANEIYLKTGGWYENKGYKEEACLYYLKGKAYEKAIVLIEAVSSALIYQGQFTMLQKWIEIIPAAYFHNSFRLMLNYVWICLSKCKNDDAKYYIETIENRFEKINKKDMSPLVGEFLIAKAFVSMGDLEQSIGLLKRAMELVDNFNPNYPAALMSIATSYITHGKLMEAEQYYFKALAASRKSENLHSAAYSWGSLGMMMTCQGRFKEAESLYKEAEEYLSEKGGKSIPLLGIVFSGLSEIFYYRNEIEKAYESSRKAIEYFERGGLFDIKNNCYIVNARALLAKGNKARAVEEINKAISLSERDKIYGFKRHTDYCRARFFLDIDELDEAEYFIEQYRLSMKEPIERYDLHDYVLLAELLIKSRRFEEGISCIEKIMQEGTGGKLYEVQLRIMKADALFSMSDAETAYKELYNALMDCKRENYTRVFINYGARMRDLLKMFIDYRISRYDSAGSRYAKELLESMNRMTKKKAKASNILTNREFEVLKLISEGASNEEIAKRLFISLSTVKSHTLNIFGKLGVNSRSKAVVEAEKRGFNHTFY